MRFFCKAAGSSSCPSPPSHRNAAAAVIWPLSRYCEVDNEMRTRGAFITDNSHCLFVALWYNCFCPPAPMMSRVSEVALTIHPQVKSPTSDLYLPPSSCPSVPVVPPHHHAAPAAAAALNRCRSPSISQWQRRRRRRYLLAISVRTRERRALTHCTVVPSPISYFIMRGNSTHQQHFESRRGDAIVTTITSICFNIFNKKKVV